MPRRYNLRRAARDVTWIEDESLKTKEEVESEEEDEDYEPPSESEEETEEEEEEEDDEEEPPTKPQSITIPIPTHGVVKIEIDNRGVPTYEDEEMDEDEDDEEGEAADSFLDYLANKYAPRSRAKKPAGDKDEEEAALDLNDEEQDYFDDLPKSKQRKLHRQMKEVSALVSSGGVPNKFRVLELPIADAVKAAVIQYTTSQAAALTSCAGTSWAMSTSVNGAAARSSLPFISAT
jgi:hypothetical protein